MRTTTRSPILPHFCVSIVVALTLLLFAWVNVGAQDVVCKSKLSELPHANELKGFWPGMTREQVKARVPEIAFGPTDKLGVSKTTINPAFDPRADHSSFQDVRTISLDFLDDRLTSLWFGYDKSFKWATVDDFVTGISRSLALPNSWSPWRLNGRQLRCGDFQLTLSLLAGSPSFRILDLTAEETLSARRAAEVESSDDEAASDEASGVIGDSDSRIYYRVNCQAVKEILAANRVVFKAAAEAEKAGYKPARECEE